MKNQQKPDPFLKTLRLFVGKKELPTSQRYCNIMKRFGPSCFIKNDLLMIKHIEHSSAFSGQDKQDSTRYCNYVHILGQ